MVVVRCCVVFACCCRVRVSLSCVVACLVAVGCCVLLVDSCCRPRLCVVLLGVGDRALVVVCLLFLLLYVDVCCCGMCSMTPLRVVVG